MATAPSCGADIDMKEPLNLAVGVLEADKMYASWISFRTGAVVLKWLRSWERRAEDAAVCAVARRAGAAREDMSDEGCDKSCEAVCGRYEEASLRDVEDQ